MHIDRRYRMALVVWFLLASSLSADDWPQWRGPQRDGVWREHGIVETFDSPQLKYRWRVAIGAGYSSPVVADGRVYVTDRQLEPEQIERVHCFDWKTGERLWTHSYPCIYAGISYTAGPRAAMAIARGRAYSLGAMGHLHCFDAATGEVLWSRDLLEQFEIRMPAWGIAAAPLVDGERVIVQIGGSNGACLVALDTVTGEEQWRSVEDGASYSAPIITEQAGQRVLICWTAENVVGVDPETGKQHWQVPFKPSDLMSYITTPIVSNNRVLVSAYFDGALMVQLSANELSAQTLWHRRGPSVRDTEALHSVMSTPYFDGDFVYGVDSYGELRCLRAETGDRVWEDLTAVPRANWATIHMIRHGERTLLFNERGELIIAKLSPQGYEEISRAQLIKPTTEQLRQRNGVCWSHPAFAYKHVFARNDEELVCVDLSAAE